MISICLTLLRTLLFLALAAFVVSFITTNTTAVSIGLFPLPFEVELPVYALGLGMLFIGLITGGLMTSVSSCASSLRQRHSRRQTRQKMMAMEHELESLRVEKNASTRHSTPLPLLPTQKHG